MGILWLFFLIIGIAATNSAKPSNLTVCEDVCKKCENRSERTRCLVICPTDFNPHTLCKSSHKTNEIVIGVSIGVLLCLIIAMGGLLCVRLRKRKKDRLPKQSAKELKNFHKDIDRLRPHAYTFLGILNNVRRQVREMHRAGNTDAAVICGRSLSDLAKILMILNRREISIVPPDWQRLANWADSLLERSTMVNPPQQQQQVAQLIQFFQNPTPRPREYPETNHSTPMSTLKPPAYEDYVPLRDQNPFTNFQYGKTEWTQQWEFPQETAYDGRGSSHDDAWQSREPAVQENLWIDDDFFMMTTFRPQDEIVTVL